MVMAIQEPLKVDIDRDVKRAFLQVLARQGTSNKEGAARLLAWFVGQPPELQAVILGQAPGNAAEMIARSIIQQAEVGDLAIVKGGKDDVNLQEQRRRQAHARSGAAEK
jgi:hypothetical protein